MSTVSLTLPSDGDTIDASDVNNPLNAIAAVINGGIDSTNITAGGLTPANLTTGTGSSWVWQSWTPTFTNMSGGTLTYGSYTQIGKTVFYRFKYTLAGANISGNLSFAPPVTTSSNYSLDSNLGMSSLIDSATQHFQGTVQWASASSFVMRATTVSGANVIASANVNATVPFTWGAADYIAVQGFYEAA